MAAFLAVLALGAALRFYRLERESFWIDEVLSLEVARQPWPSLLAATGHDGHPPLYAAALRTWILTFGDGDAAVRSLSALFGVTALPAFFLLARRLLPTGGALVGTLLFACSSYHIYYSQEARNYALLVLLTLLSWLALLALDEEPRPARGAAYVAATVFLLYTHVFAFFVWGAQILWMAFRLRTRDRRLARAVPMVVTAILVAPWIVAPWTALLLRQSSVRTTGLHLVRPTLWTVLTSAYQLAGSPVTAAILLPAAALEAYRGLVGGESGRSRTALLLLWAVVPHLLPFAVSQVAAPIYITRATIVTLPALYLLAAAFLARLGAWPRAILVSVAVVGALAAQVLYFRVPTKEQWREVAATVDERAIAGDVAVFDAGYGRPGFDHYSRTAVLQKVSLGADLTSPAGAAELAGALPSSAPRLWLVRFQRPPAKEAVVEALAGRYRLAGSGSYTGIELYLFVGGSP